MNPNVNFSQDSYHCNTSKDRTRITQSPCQAATPKERSAWRRDTCKYGCWRVLNAVEALGLRDVEGHGAGFGVESWAKLKGPGTQDFSSLVPNTIKNWLSKYWALGPSVFSPPPPPPPPILAGGRSGGARLWELGPRTPSHRGRSAPISIPV